MKKIFSLLGVTLLLASCTEDYKDWANPQTNAPEDPKSVSVEVGAVSETIDLAAAGDSVQLFIPSVTVSDESTTTYTVMATNDSGTKEFELGCDARGCVPTAEVQDAVVTLYNANPFEVRNLNLNITSYTVVNGQSFKFVSQAVAKVTPVGPNIEPAYYLTGNINGWDNTNTDYKLTNDGSNPYDNPKFAMTIPAPADGSDIEFKLTPESGIGGDWSGCLAAGSEEGTFNYDNNGGNFQITAVEGAKFYRITLDMLEQTWSYKALSFGEFFYEIGNEGGWSTNHALYGATGDGKYVGFYYLDGEYKFKPNANDWNNDLEYVSGDTMSGTLTDAGGPNCPDPGAGFYQINLDAAEMTFSLTKIESISLIGGFNDWNGDVEMSYNATEGCWEVTTDAVSGEYKFRANHDWTINWGGSVTSLTQNGDNLSIEAGTHTFKLFLSYDGAHYVTIE